MAVPRKIAVAGATGRVGRHVVDVLTETGHDVVPISRATGVDVVTGDGLAAALTGVDCVIDVATGASGEQAPATAFFTTAARNLQQTGAQAGVRRIVVASIIGVDRLTSGGYSAAKLAHEQAYLSGPIPVRILRAAQFHEFVAQLIEWGRQGDISYVPRMRTQLVAARTVAEALADLALEDLALEDLPPESVGTVPGLETTEAPREIAGPRPESLVDMATLFIARRGGPAKIEPVHDTKNPDTDAIESGILLPGPNATLAGPTFEEWLVTTA